MRIPIARQSQDAISFHLIPMLQIRACRLPVLSSRTARSGPLARPTAGSSMAPASTTPTLEYRSEPRSRKISLSISGSSFSTSSTTHNSRIRAEISLAGISELSATLATRVSGKSASSSTGSWSIESGGRSGFPLRPLSLCSELSFFLCLDPGNHR
jgi:hypothetical protein